jgi:predicted HNH restriction endonuclease
MPYETSDYPSQATMFVPILHFMSELGGIIQFSTEGDLIESKLADYYELSQEQRERKSPDCNAKGQRVWRNHIQYASNKMIEKQLIQRPIRDVWKILPKGYDALSLGRNLPSQEPISHAAIRGRVEIIGEEEESLFPEGVAYYKLHRSLERDSRIVKLAKQKRLLEKSELKCDVCDFDFFETYGVIGEGFIEAHHSTPVSALDQTTTTKISDLNLVCSNCHRILHRKRPWLSVYELKKLLQK